MYYLTSGNDVDLLVLSFLFGFLLSLLCSVLFLFDILFFSSLGDFWPTLFFSFSCQVLFFR